MIKKLIALTLVTLMLGAALVSCGKNSDVPDGMQSATVEGEPFVLYVPDTWSVNTKSGISSAYSYAYDTMIASARYYAPMSAEQTLDEHMVACAESYSQTAKDFYLVSREAALLGGKDARRLEYTMTDGGQNYTCVQYTTRHGDDFVSLYFYYLTSQKDAVSEAFESIRAAFVLCEHKAPAQSDLVDDKTPEGMKIASGKNDAHRLYVPTSWVCFPESGRTEAYVDESGKPNVTVTLTVPDTSMSIDEYLTSCKTRYAEALAGYEEIETRDREVAGRRAISTTYRAVYDGVAFRIMQTVLSDGDAMYSVTYTALEDRYDTYLADVEQMLGVFTFR